MGPVYYTALNIYVYKIFNTIDSLTPLLELRSEY